MYIYICMYILIMLDVVVSYYIIILERRNLDLLSKLRSTHFKDHFWFINFKLFQFHNCLE